MRLHDPIKSRTGSDAWGPSPLGYRMTFDLMDIGSEVIRARAGDVTSHSKAVDRRATLDELSDSARCEATANEYLNMPEPR